MIQRTRTKNGKKPVDRLEDQVRVAVYTRKSTEHGMDQAFTSIDAQREAILGYVASKRHQGWAPLPQTYDDAGHTGAHTRRPAFERLMRDVDAGLVDAIVVYKLDRLSRSLIDFIQVSNHLDENGVAFVSVTESFDTSNSVGRLIIQILAVFAQFERERIGERTRDKIVAARRKGLWTGGRPGLGYDVRDKKLLVNKKEAERVREVFQLYLKIGSLIGVTMELNRRGLRSKGHTGKNGVRHPGREFTRSAVRKILTNPVYLGQVRCHGDLFDGEHEAIVDEDTWQAARALMKENANPRTWAWTERSYLLSGLLKCGGCGAAMVHESNRSSGRIYRYYTCGKIKQKGWGACRGSRVRAGLIEAFIVDKIRAIGTDEKVLAATLEAAREAFDARRPELTAELRRLGKKKDDLQREEAHLVEAIGEEKAAPRAVRRKLDEIERELEGSQAEAERVAAELQALEAHVLDEDDLRRAMLAFDDVFDQLAPEEKARIVQLLLEKVVYDAKEDEVSLTLRPNGITVFAEEAEQDDDDAEVQGGVQEDG